jgi:hypothetical protein
MCPESDLGLVFDRGQKLKRIPEELESERQRIRVKYTVYIIKFIVLCRIHCTAV